MDKGRQIDNVQNTNARWIDQYNQTNKTSVKTSNPPGGKSSFSLGWSDPEPVPQRKNNQITNNTPSEDNSNKNTWNKLANRNNQSLNSNNAYDNSANNQTEKTSVRVKYAPGGQSNIIFGNDQTNYDDFKKNSGQGLYRK